MAESNEVVNANLDGKDITEESSQATEEEQSSSSPENPPKTPPPAGEIPSPGQWFNSYFGAEWISKAKEQVALISLIARFISICLQIQTMNTLESVKKDFNEFSDTVQHEVAALTNAGTKTIKHQAELFQQFVTTPDAQEETPKEKAEGVGVSHMYCIILNLGQWLRNWMG